MRELLSKINKINFFLINTPKGYYRKEVWDEFDMIHYVDPVEEAEREFIQLLYKLGQKREFISLMSQEEALENDKLLQKMEDISQEWEWAANEADSQEWFLENGKTQEERDAAQVHLKEDQIWLDDLATKETLIQNKYKDFIWDVKCRLNL